MEDPLRASATNATQLPTAQLSTVATRKIKKGPGMKKKRRAVASVIVAPRLTQVLLPFRERRPLLLEKAHLDMMTAKPNGTFTNATIECDSRRSTNGKPYECREIAVNTVFLQEVSSQLSCLFDGLNVMIVDYDEDSDLEWDKGPVMAKIPAVTQQPTPGNPLEGPAEHGRNFSSSVAVSFNGDDDPSLLEGDTDSETDALMESLLVSDSPQGSPQIPVPGAYKTWQAINLYYLMDRVSFSHLRSQQPLLLPKSPGNLPNQSLVSASPKSIYRLAVHFKLDDLKVLATAAIKASLSASNIIGELFSDFTWRYPEILAAETDVYYVHRRNPKVVEDLAGIYNLIESHYQPRYLVVLKAIHTKLV